MKAWIRDFDFLKFREELQFLPGEFSVVSATEYAQFTGAPNRRFFDFALDKAIQQLGVPGSCSAQMGLVIPKQEVALFFDELRRLNTSLFEYSYRHESPNLFFVEFNLEVRKCSQPVTAVVPCFNSDIALLETSLRSVMHALDQTGFPESCQLLVIDDCSTNSADIQALIKRLFDNDSRVQFSRLSENRGVSTIRNLGIANSRNDIVLFVDHDDTIEPLHFNLLAQDIIRKNADIAVGNMRFPDRHIFCAHLSEHRGFLIENGFGSGIAINKASTRVKSLLGTGELYNNKSRSHFEDWELNSVAKLLDWKISITPYASYFYTYMPTGRDSTNLTLKRRASLLTPLYAIERVKQLSRENAYSYLREYSQCLVEQMLTSEERWDLERQELLKRLCAAQQIVLPNNVTIQGLLPNALPIVVPQPNRVARAKMSIKKWEAKLSSNRVLYKLYYCTLRPALYSFYRSVRFMYRIASGKNA